MNTLPALVEPGAKYFLNETLKQCREFKNKYQNTLINIGLLVLFLCTLGGILLYKYRGKMTPIELEEKEKSKMQYILSKIKNFQSAKRAAQQQLITGLPHYL